MDSKKFQNKIRCICDKLIHFEIIDGIECDWGVHTTIQCPNCQELFSIDYCCPAFHDVLDLEKNNFELFSDKEKYDYTTYSHPN